MVYWFRSNELGTRIIWRVRRLCLKVNRFFKTGLHVKTFPRWIILKGYQTVF